MVDKSASSGPPMPGGGGKTSVDLRSLESAVTLLDELTGFVAGLRDGSSCQLGIEPMVGTDDSPSAADALFGAHDGGRAAAQKHAATYKSMMEGLRGLEKTMRHTADGTKKIIENYKTTEERNRAAMADIAALLGGGGGGSGGGAPSASTASYPARPASAGDTSASDGKGL